MFEISACMCHGHGYDICVVCRNKYIIYYMGAPVTRHIAERVLHIEALIRCHSLTDIVLLLLQHQRLTCNAAGPAQIPLH